MSDPQRLQELAELLLEATAKGTVRWSRTPDPDTYRLRLPPGYVRVSRNRGIRADSETRESGHQVVLLNKDGLEVENWTVPGSNGGDTLPERLLAAAQRSALESDETYEGMVQNLRLKLKS